MFPCTSAATLPTVIESAAIAANMFAQSLAMSPSPNATTNIRMTTANPAALLATDRYAVIGVGAPSYTSGTHIWNGTTAILNPSPAARNTAASTSADRVPESATATNDAISLRFVEPDSPNRYAIDRKR